MGVAATLAAELVGDGRSATSAVLGVLFDVGSATDRPGRIVTLVLYGTVGGLALVALELYVLEAVDVPPSPVEAYGLAVAWGAVLLAAFAAVYRFALGLRFDRDVLVELLVYHIVLGLGLGIWIRMTWIN